MGQLKEKDKSFLVLLALLHTALAIDILVCLMAGRTNSASFILGMLFCYDLWLIIDTWMKHRKEAIRK